MNTIISGKLSKKIGLMLFGISLVFSSCNEQDFNEIADNNVNGFPYTCKMNFESGAPSYETEPASRTDEQTGNEWKDGDKIFLRFANGGNVVRGIATYSSTGGWTVGYYQQLSTVETDKCEAVYIENATGETNTQILMNDKSAVYGTVDAIYAFDGKSVTLGATLLPMSSRVRFKGTDNDTVFIGGLKYYSMYDILENTFTEKESKIYSVVGIGEGAEPGYTPYTYGEFDNPQKRLFYSGINKSYYQTFGSEVLEGNKSGWIGLPTASNNNGWISSNTLYNLVWADSIPTERRDIIQNMINNLVYVEGGRIRIGAQSSNQNMDNYDSDASSNESPVHTVIFSPYYMSKYEVTEELWNAVMGTNSIKRGNNYPITLQQNKVLQFIDKLNLITGMEFDIPTEYEWEYASRGGRKTHYYIYSGSNNFYSVGYSYIREIAQHAPNELGIYDMSGNAGELCKYVGEYTNSTKLCPEIDNEEYILRGAGSEYSYEEYFRNTIRITSFNENNCGIRLILRIK